MRSLLIFGLLLSSFIIPTARALEWDDEAGDNNWMNPINWETNTIPAGVPATVINGTAIVMSQEFPTVPPVTILEVGRLSDPGTVILEGNTANASIEVLQNTIVSSQGVLQLNTGGANTSTLMTFAMSNEGDVTVNSGGTINAFAGPYLQSNGRTVLDGGTIDANLTHIMDGALRGEGDLTGNLLIGGLPASAEPELSPGGVGGLGTINVGGDLELRDNSVLKIEIDGTGPTTTADLVDVSGMATLGGTLDLNLVAGSIPIGEQVSIMVADSFADGFQFDEITGVETENGALIVVLDTTQSSPVICVYEGTEPGDMNGDSVVNNFDARLFAWAIRDLESYEEVFYDPATPVPCSDPTKTCGPALRSFADMDNDRRYTFLDVQLFLEEVAESEGSAAAAWNEISAILSGPPIPEPTSVCLLSSLIMVTLAAHRNRGRTPGFFEQ